MRELRIPAGGMGEIAATVGGQRFTGSAREAQGLAIARGAAVTVVRVVGASRNAAFDGAEG